MKKFLMITLLLGCCAVAVAEDKNDPLADKSVIYVVTDVQADMGFLVAEPAAVAKTDFAMPLTLPLPGGATVGVGDEIRFTLTVVKKGAPGQKAVVAHGGPDCPCPACVQGRKTEEDFDAFIDQAFDAKTPDDVKSLKTKAKALLRDLR